MEHERSRDGGILCYLEYGCVQQNLLLQQKTLSMTIPDLERFGRVVHEIWMAALTYHFAFGSCSLSFILSST
jgi:hypothetical protein